MTILEEAIDNVLFPNPMVTVDIDLGGLELDELNAVRLEKTVSWVAQSKGDAVELSLQHDVENDTLVRIQMSPGYHQKLIMDLQRLLSHRKSECPTYAESKKCRLAPS